MLEPIAFEFEMGIQKLKRRNSPGIDQIPSELNEAEGITMRCEIDKLIIFIQNKEELPEE